MPKKLMKGAEAIGEAAVRTGCRAYFCYPITPQTEVAEYLARRMPEVGGVFLQAESELAAANMLFGAAAAGVPVFTSSSSPGVSLMSEAISYIAGAQLPVVIINIVRGGPGLGGILPAQGDYFQATKGGGHGDYHCLVLAPSSVQEAVDLTMAAFQLAEDYRNPVIVIGDGMIGQMMEPVSFDTDSTLRVPDKRGWATTGCEGREPNLVKTLYLDPHELERLNRTLDQKYRRMREKEVRFETYNMEAGPSIVVVAYGTVARICKTAIDELKREGREVGLLRPISLFPFPEKELEEIAEAPTTEQLLVVEMSLGQMLEDVERATRRQKPIRFYGRQGGVVPAPEEVVEQLRAMIAAGESGAKARGRETPQGG